MSTVPGAVYIAQQDGTYKRAVVGDPIWDSVYCIAEDRFKSMEDLKEVLPHIYESITSMRTSAFC
jgi:hypothetical protein